MRLLQRMLVLFAIGLFAWSATAAATSMPDDWRESLARGLALRAEGKQSEAITALQEAMRQAKNTSGSVQVAAELGATLLQAGRAVEAETPLLEAHTASTGETRAIVANALGNLYYAQRRNERAALYYRDAIESSRVDSPLWLGASLNLARTRPTERRLDLLSALRPRLDMHRDTSIGIILLINLGTQALSLGKDGQALAHESLERARALATTEGNLRLQLEALDGLGQLYEADGRWPEVVALTGLALALVDKNAAATLEDVLLQLEWRRGRAFQALQQNDQALAAYHRAVEMTGVIRQDLPIEFFDGRSSYKTLLEPLHHGYVDLLLNSLERQPVEREQMVLGQVRDAIEVLRQSEMQDFLGDRCSVEEAESSRRIEPRTAILYPILLKDRIELLVETAKGLSRFRQALPGSRLRDTAREFASMLRAGNDAYARRAIALYDALIKPVAPLLAAQQVGTLVIVPDGELRLVPFAALRDDKGFLVERFAVATVTGMSMTNLNPGPSKTPKALLAGVAEPGAVVEKVAANDILREAGENASRGEPGGKLSKGRSLRFAAAVAFTHLNSDKARIAAAKEALALPGVKEEISALGAILPGSTQLLDDSFTVGRFRSEGEAGDYRILHIASHGVFGGSAETSYVLAHDDLLTINRLQSVLRSETVQRTPVELLTLSACETAEGNDRAPLGIAGAAIRARAKSVLGTLWPVDDNAARMTMEAFYAGIVDNRSKAASLQQAQLNLIKNPIYTHPFFWAPFSLIGNWR